MSNTLVGSVNARWGRIEIIKRHDLSYQPIMIHNSGKKMELPSKYNLSDALQLAHSKVKSDPFQQSKSLKRLDVFTDVDPDVTPAQDISKKWRDDDRREQNMMNEIDREEQRRFGGIKPIDEQFPGEEHGYDPADSFESDNIRREIMRLK